MTEEWLAAGRMLADVLARENAALDALDLTGAVQLVPEKTRASAAFDQAQAVVAAIGPDPAHKDAAAALASRLQVLAAENRRLLERGLALQRRLINTILMLVPRAAAEQQPRYAANGALAGVSHLPALALSTRA